MNIVITASGRTKEAQFSPRFGRCSDFIKIDTEIGNVAAFANPAIEARGGAGPHAVQFLASLDVDIVISGRFGPNAFSALEAAGIKAYIASSGTVGEVLQQYLDGQLEPVDAATGSKYHGSSR